MNSGFTNEEVFADLSENYSSNSSGISVNQDKWANNEEKIGAMEEQFVRSLEDYKEAYVLYKINADIPDYKNTLLLKEQSLHVLNKDVFLLKNGLEASIGKTNAQLSKIQKAILLEKGVQRREDRRYNQIKGTEGSAVSMTHQFTENYKAQYISNLTLFLGTLLLVYFLVRLRGSGSGTSLPALPSLPMNK